MAARNTSFASVRRGDEDGGPDKAHGDSSQGINPSGFPKSRLRKPVFDENYSMCKMCRSEHAPDFYCGFEKCCVCYKMHPSSFCPYLHSFPQGEDYNKDKYQINCQCGNEFNEDKWVCTSCGANWAVLVRKCCLLCDSFGHGSYECPKDKVGAAKSKLARDKRRARVPKVIPYTPALLQSLMDGKRKASLPKHELPMY